MYLLFLSYPNVFCGFCATCYLTSVVNDNTHTQCDNVTKFSDNLQRKCELMGLSSYDFHHVLFVKSISIELYNILL